MDSFDIIDNVKAEKRNAMLKYRRVRNIGILFRFFELCLALIFLSWFSTRLPDAIKISGEYFKDLSVFVISPRFVFLIGNAIILTLFAKSGRQQNPNGTSAGTDLYDEYIKSSENSRKISTEYHFSTTPEEIAVVVVEDKQIDTEKSSVTEIHAAPPQVIAKTVRKSVQRSQSVNINHSFSEKHERELRRTETDICRNVVQIPEKKSDKKKKKTFADDQEMSNEEFQRKIEAFIAKQMRFHKEESMAIVLQNQSREPVMIRSWEIKV